MFRYSQFDQEEANTTNIVGLNTIHVLGHNYVGHWTHTFSPTAFSDVYFGRNYGDTITGTGFPGETAGFLGQLQTLGMSKSWMTLDNKLYAPQWSADNYSSLSGSQLQETGLADNWQFGGAFTKILGKHTIKAGATEETPGHPCCLVFPVRPAIETSSRWLAAAGLMDCSFRIRSKRRAVLQSMSDSATTSLATDLRDRQRRQFLHRRGQPDHRPVHPQRASA